ncbi:P-loop containing nucleoside triphosphate hydrolase protein [Trametes versicolor FP-101664 SS1]|uniref:P-loop containing nucleoside triphosphate hydrolase protein n=1 Tax=Trametes versicolor (strain FP-101664) TaxID=717944 RepID=UPI000462277D|nr:P-loop containing nucleoside triphosphate hydrolase protein [Trametes versicolor FP-101664 SS1]EIW62771.1 P-loop containing nucleoside triphosphate hydrolase protein [Trametes versicolor FP-101664 SS1]
MSISRERPAPATRFLFCSNEGRAIVSDTVESALHYCPHDYQLDGICKSLDGIDLVAILATGAGKTAYFTMYMLLLRALSKACGQLKCDGVAVPDQSAMVIVYPTIGLETEMAKTFRAAGLSTHVINHETAGNARLEGRDIWEDVVDDTAMILLSPEMLSSDVFETLLQKKDFSSRLCALGVDEVHLCNSWGEAFRPCFRHIGLTRCRMPSRTSLILLTATLAKGTPTTNIISSFGLCAGNFHLIRRSNRRPDIQILFRMLTRGVGGPAFPDFSWVLTSGRKTIIFCPTVAHGQRLALFLRSRLPSPVDPYQFIRTYSSLKWSDFNETTLCHFHEDGGTMILIATDTLMVGVDLPNVDDVILAIAPDTVDEMLQKIGRTGRDAARVSHARGIVYVSKSTVDAARKQVGAEVTKTRKTPASSIGVAAACSKRLVKLLNPAMARMIVADCKTAAQDAIYENPAVDEPCSCTKCRARPPPPLICRCSGCEPEDNNHPDAMNMDPPVPAPPFLSRLPNPILNVSPSL